MSRQEILKNIEIARKYLDSFHLLLPNDKILFDCYCLPSFGFKAFYAQIYKTNGIFRANCAYTHYADYLGLESYSVCFANIEKDKHTAKKADVICKSVFPDPDIINTLSKYAGEFTSVEHFANENTIILDGISAGIRFFETGCLIHDIYLIDSEDNLPLLDKLLLFSDTV